MSSQWGRCELSVESAEVAFGLASTANVVESDDRRDELRRCVQHGLMKVVPRCWLGASSTRAIHPPKRLHLVEAE